VTRPKLQGSRELQRWGFLIAPLLAACAAGAACGGRATKDDGDGAEVAGAAPSGGTGASAGASSIDGGSGFGGAGIDPNALAFSRIVAGRDHYCGITQSDKRLVCVADGQIVSDEPGPYLALDMNDDIAQWEYRCAIKETGELACSGSTDVPAPAGEFVDVSVGAFNACARRATGEVECWLPESLGGLTRIEYAPARYSVDLWSFCWQRSMLDAGCSGRDGRELLPTDGSGHFAGGLFVSVKAAPEAGCAAILVAIAGQEYEEFGGILNKNNIACFSASGARSKIDGLFNAFDVNANEDGCAIVTDGGSHPPVACWGAFEGSVPVNATGPVDQVSVSTGLACVLRDTGSVQCWPPAR
jgi:hypothetical protein